MSFEGLTWAVMREDENLMLSGRKKVVPPEGD